MQLCQLRIPHQKEKKKKQLKSLEESKVETPVSTVDASTIPRVIERPATVAPSSSRTVVDTPTEAPKRQTKPPHVGTSLRDLGSEKTVKSTAAPTTTILKEQYANFTGEDLLQAWIGYAESLEKQVHLKIPC